ncbi:MAG: general secretion pathway protein GspE [Candidatus Xenobia bacterium]
MIKSEIPLDFWQRHRILPIEDALDRVTVGIHQGTPRDLLEDIRLALRKDVRAVVMSLDEIEDGLRRMLVEDTRSRSGGEDGTPNIEVPTSQDLLTEAAGAPVVRLINAIFLEAMQNGASDIHVEPYEEESLVRMRVDGVLHEIHRVPRSRHAQMAARLKVMARLDLAETRRPQDGRLHVHSGERHIDVRVSCVPTLHGERVVLRLLEKDIRLFSMDQLGFTPTEQKVISDILSHPYGLVLVTGPTGSGKTTTLYAFLQTLRSPHCNIITIEDPVEYQVAGVGQIQVNEKIGVTFAAGLRSVLRQDPDILMVGEIRDPETAEIAIHAALTGHMVLSTLHTNDAPTAASRLLDLGVPPYLLSSSLLGVMAQRLVRRLCPHCKKPYKPEATELRQLGFASMPENPQFHRPGGCAACLNTGYKGRMGVFELMVVDSDLASRIARSEDARALRRAAQERGMRSLVEDAGIKVSRGLTSSEEALRVSRM